MNNSLLTVSKTDRSLSSLVSPSIVVLSYKKTYSLIKNPNKELFLIKNK